MKRRHSMPFGAECTPDGQVRFRLWAPKARKVSLCFAETAEERCLEMTRNEDWFELTTALAAPGTRYKFQIDGGMKVPDPASRYQPEDVHCGSEVVDPSTFDWQDQHWCGRPWEEAVLYELHTGTFTPEGTFAGVEQRLPYLAELGVTAVELMPVADFPGARNWGYDGVFPFAPDSRYGRPNDLKHLIQAAHKLGLMMFLDVVYNHFGPEGNYLHEYAPQFFTERYRTPWGEAINYDGPESGTVRRFFIENALYWLHEYHFDGLRLDAVHQIFDRSPLHFLDELAQTVRSSVGSERHVHLVLENDENAARYLKRGPGREARLYNAQWNDDFHHAIHVAITGERDGYYCDYADHPVERLGRCLTEGFDYQGQESPFRGNERRGECSRHLPPGAFVPFLQNHDQTGNRAFGERITALAEPLAIEAALAIQLLAPSPPLLFMGEEFGAETPFLFFCDFGPELAERVTQGRREEFSRFERFSDPAAQTRIPDPNAHTTFALSKLNWDSLSQESSQGWLKTYRKLLKLRQNYIVPLLPFIQGGHAKFKKLSARAIEAWWQTEGDSILTVVANLNNEPLADFSRPAGEMFYATPADNGTEKQLAPWTVRWFLRP